MDGADNMRDSTILLHVTSYLWLAPYVPSNFF